MRVCIVTRIDYKNYGNRLQNYALQGLLRKENLEVCSGLEVVSKEEWISRENGVIKKVLKNLVPFALFSRLNSGAFTIGSKDPDMTTRKKRFREFTENYIPTLPCFIVKNKEQLYKELDRYGFAYYIAGSDQIWNPYFSGRDYEFLTFAPYEKRLSFSASFGVKSIPIQDKKRYKTLLDGIKYLSIREPEGVEIVKDLTNRNDVYLTLDPTLLLAKEEWEKIVDKCKMNKAKHYIASYFLGKTPDAVLRFTESMGLPLMRMNEKKDKELYAIDPIGFLGIIHDADYILTDSFHGVAFSILFHREFYVFKRRDEKEDMFGRIEHLLSMFELTDRFQANDRLCLCDRIGEEKWKKIDEYLKFEKEVSINKLKYAMNLKANI